MKQLKLAILLTSSALIFPLHSAFSEETTDQFPDPYSDGVASSFNTAFAISGFDMGSTSPKNYGDFSENIDPHKGGLSITQTDYVFHGDGNISLPIVRTYQNLQNAVTGSSNTSDIGAMGVGWDVHFGKIWVTDERDIGGQWGGRQIGSLSQLVHGCTYFGLNNDAAQKNPILVLPSGENEVLYTGSVLPNMPDAPESGDLYKHSQFMTRSHWIGRCLKEEEDISTKGGLVVFAPNGWKYTFNDYGPMAYVHGENWGKVGFPAMGGYPTQRWAYAVSKIEDLNGNVITFNYHQRTGDELLKISTISFQGVTLTFLYVGEKLSSISGEGVVINYQYVGENLDSVNIGGELNWDYKYHTYGDGINSLKSVVSPLGKKTEYNYSKTKYIEMSSSTPTSPPPGIVQNGLSSVGVSEKIVSGPDIRQHTTTYIYTPGQTDVTKVTFSGSDALSYTIQYKHLGYEGTKPPENSNSVPIMFRRGILLEKSFSTSGVNQTETYTYAAKAIVSKTKTWQPYPEQMENCVWTPLLTEKQIVRNGLVYKTDYKYTTGTTYDNSLDICPDYGLFFPTNAVVKQEEAGPDGSIVKEFFWDKKIIVDGLIKSYKLTDAGWILKDKADQIFGVTKVIDANGNAKSVNDHGIVTKYEYELGNVVSASINGEVTTFGDYKSGTPKTISLPDGTSIARSLDDRGNISSETILKDGLASTTARTFDTLNRITSVSPPVGGNISVDYSSNQKRVEMTRTSGAASDYTESRDYDSNGNLLIENKVGLESEYQYDSMGNQIYASELGYPLRVTQSTYDAFGRILTSSQDGQSSQYAYSQNLVTINRNITLHHAFAEVMQYKVFGGNPDEKFLTSHSIPTGTTEYEHNGSGRIESVTQDGVKQSYIYNFPNLVSAVKRPDIQILYCRDGAGRIVREIKTSDSSVQSGCVGSSSLPVGASIKHITYANGIPVSIQYGHDWGRPITLKYNQLGQLLNASVAQLGQQTAETWTASYDGNGNLKTEKSERNGRSYLFTYEYDNLDHIKSLTYPNNDSITFSPDIFGRPTAVTYIHSGAPSISLASGVEYFPNGQIKTFMRENGVASTQEQTSTGIPLPTTLVDGSNVLNISYNYDGIGNVKGIVDDVTGGLSRSNILYDESSRLKSLYANGLQHQYSYNGNGDILKMSVGENSCDYDYSNATRRLQKVSAGCRNNSYQLAYDDSGNVVNAQKLTYEVSGTVKDESKTFQFNQAGQLIKQDGQEYARYDLAGNRSMSFLDIWNGSQLERRGLSSVYNAAGKLLLDADLDPVNQSGSRDNFRNYVYLGGTLLASIDDCRRNANYSSGMCPDANDDGDDLTYRQEEANGSSPFDDDSDDDGIDDDDEVTQTGTDPANADSDGDQFNDFVDLSPLNSGFATYLDQSFDGDGIASFYKTSANYGFSAVAQQSDGKLIALTDQDSDQHLVRFHSNGSLDSDFGINGVLAIDCKKIAPSCYLQKIRGLSVDNNDDIVVYGDIVLPGYYSRHHVFIARYGKQGELDKEFGQDQGAVIKQFAEVHPQAWWISTNASSYVTSSLLRDDGKMLFAGTAWIYTPGTTAPDDGKVHLLVAHFDKFGSLISPTNDSKPLLIPLDYLSEGAFTRMIELANGGVMIAVVNNASDKVFLVQLDGSGNLDATFGGDGIVEAAIGSSLDSNISGVQQADGKLVIAGSKNIGSGYQFFVTRYNQDGTLDSSFDSDGILTAAPANNNKIAGISQQQDGKLLLMGESDGKPSLIRFNLDGSIDTSIVSNGAGGIGSLTVVEEIKSANVNTMALQFDGKYLLAGRVDFGGSSFPTLFRYVVTPDTDSDGIYDSVDIFPDNAAEAFDADNDTVGDNADSDKDGDGDLNINDNCPLVVNPDQVDTDSDGIGDSCDGCNLGAEDACMVDTDNDGIGSSVDNCFAISNADQSDIDADGVGDACDEDKDGDWIANGDDNCPDRINVAQEDINSDDIGDVCGTDVDSDTAVDDTDIKPLDAAWKSYLDNSLNDDGILYLAKRNDREHFGLVDVAIQQDKKMVTVGWIKSAITGNTDILLSRYNVDGSVDTDFGENGNVITSVSSLDDMPVDVFVQHDEKIVVLSNQNESVGSGTGCCRVALLRYNQNGSLDSTFANAGIATKVMYSSSNTDILGGVSVGQQLDKKLVVVGVQQSADSSNKNFGVLRFNVDGSPDALFGTSGLSALDLGTDNDEATTFAQTDDGKLIVAGSNGSSFAVIRLQPNGSLDDSFGIGGKSLIGFEGSSTAYAMAIQPDDGKLVLAGKDHANGRDSFALVRLTNAGAVDTSFDIDGKVITSFPGIDAAFNSITLQQGNKILASGSIERPLNEVNTVALVRYNADGGLDASFSLDGSLVLPILSDNGSKNIAKSLPVLSDGRVVVSVGSHPGDIGSLNTTNALIRLVVSPDTDGDGWYDNVDPYPEDDDIDNDTIIDSLDNCLTISNAGQIDTDLDGQGDDCDADDDNDGVDDWHIDGGGIYDNCSTVQNPDQLDSDNDGKGNACDPDSDNDLIDNDVDNCRYTPNADQLDRDGDGEGNACDPDMDGDSVLNEADPDPLDPTVSTYLDLSFSGDGKQTRDISGNDIANAVVIQSNGKIVVAGSNGTNNFMLTRFSSTGVADSAFGTAGTVSTDIAGIDKAASMVQQQDGNLVAAGYATVSGSYNDFAVVRYTPEGLLDTAFSDGKVTTAVSLSTDQALAIIQQADGKLVAAGFAYIGGTGVANSDFAVVRYNQDGSLDSSFDGDGIVTVDFQGKEDRATTLVQQTDGKLVVAGYATTVNADLDFAMVRLNADGSIDSTFAGSGKFIAAMSTGTEADSIQSVTQQSDGKLVAAGYASATLSGKNFAVIRLTTSGAFDTEFGDGHSGKIITPAVSSNASDQAVTVIQQADGKLLVAGYGSVFSTGNDFILVRYTADGSLDTSFNTTGILSTAFTSAGSSDITYAMALQPDGKAVLAGSSSSDIAVARYNIASDSDSDGVTNSKDWFPSDPSEHADGDHDGIGNNQDDDKDSDAVGDATDSCPSFFNTDQLDFDFDGQGDACDNDDDNDATPDYHDPAPRNAGWKSWLDDQFGNKGVVLSNASVSTSTNDVARSVIHENGYLYVAGDNASTFVLSRYSENGGVRDASWVTNGIKTVASTKVLYGMVRDSNGFVLAGSHSTNNFAVTRLTPSGITDAGFNGGNLVNTSVSTSNDWANAISLGADGKLIAAGYAYIGGTGVVNSDFAVVRYGANGALDTSFSGDGMVTTNVGNNGSGGFSTDGANAVIQQSTGRIVAAGYAYIGGTAATKSDFALVGYSAAGELDSSFSGDGIVTQDFSSAEDNVAAIVEQADGKLVVVGYATVSDKKNFALARYSADGVPDDSFSGDGLITTSVGVGDSQATAIQLLPDGKLLVAGFAVRYSYEWAAQSDFVLVRYNSNGTLDSSFDGDGILIVPVTKYNDMAYAMTPLRDDGRITLVGSGKLGVSALTDFAIAQLQLYPDTDGDGLYDALATETDDDNDGLSDTEEGVLGSSPLVPDSDGDGIDDGVEVDNGTNPVVFGDTFGITILAHQASFSLDENWVLAMSNPAGLDITALSINDIDVLSGRSVGSVARVDDRLNYSYAGGTYATDVLSVTVTDGIATRKGIISLSLQPIGNNLALAASDTGQIVIDGTANGIFGGGAGNDILLDGTGNDILEVHTDNGNDVVFFDDATPNREDTLKFDTNIWQDSVSFTAKGDDLVINVSGEAPGTLTLIDYGKDIYRHAMNYMMINAAVTDYVAINDVLVMPMSQYQGIDPTNLLSNDFNAGSAELSLNEASLTPISNHAADSPWYENNWGFISVGVEFFDSSLPLTFSYRAIDNKDADAATGYRSIVTLNPATTVGVIHGNTSSVVNETLLGNAGVDESFAGFGGNDLLHTGDGPDTIEFSVGHGRDTVDLLPEFGSGDTLVLATGITRATTNLMRDGLDLLVKPTSSDAVRLQGYFANDQWTNPALGVSNGVMNFYQVSFVDIDSPVSGSNPPLDKAQINIAVQNGNACSACDGDVNTFSGTSGNDVAFGWAEDDHLSGGAGDDQLMGDLGADTLNPGSGHNWLSGGAGADIYQLDANSGYTTIENFDLTTGAALGEGAPHDRIELLGTVSDEHVLMLRENEDLIIKITDGTNTSVTRALTFFGASDFAQLDIVFDSSSVVWDANCVNFNTTVGPKCIKNRVLTDATQDDGDPLLADDVLLGYADSGTIYGGPGNDSITTYDGDDVLYGEAGNDVLDSGGGSTDVLYGGDGNDTLRGGWGGNTLYGEAGDDTLVAIGPYGSSMLEGGPGNDTYQLADNAWVSIYSAGGAGEDTVEFTGALRAYNLWMEEQGDALKIHVLGSTMTFTVEDWGVPGSQLQYIKAGTCSINRLALQDLIIATGGVEPSQIDNVGLNNGRWVCP